MKRLSLSLATLFALSALLSLSNSAGAQVLATPNAINFQGRLAKPDGTPVANGTYNLRFRFYDAVTDGDILYDQTLPNVPARNGTFAVQISGFTADKFNGNVWLGIKINGGNELTPRQQVVSVPYAVKSSLALTVPDASITNAKIATGTLTADRFASGVLNEAVWLLGGNSGVTSGFLGTTDNQPLLFKTNNQRGLSLQYRNNTYGTTGINVLGGYWGNVISSNATAVTVFGGSTTYVSNPNRVFDTDGTISGGENNTVGSNDGDSTSSVGGTVSGGNGNYVNGAYATIPGGYNNSANGYASFAAGGQAKARHDGTFVWQSRDGTDFTSTGVNQFLISAPGGVGVGTNAPQSALHIAPISGITLGTNSQSGGYTALNLSFSQASGGYAQLQAIKSAGSAYGDLILNPEPVGNVGIGTTNPGYKLTVNGSVAGVGNYNNVSDARYKQSIQTFPDALNALLNLRGVTFEWRQGEYPGMNFSKGTQIGFIAQEVEKVLPQLVSTDAKGYKSVAYANVVPVLVEAVKTQQKQLEEKQQQLDALAEKNAALEAKLDALAEAVKKLQKNNP